MWSNSRQKRSSWDEEITMTRNRETPLAYDLVYVLPPEFADPWRAGIHLEEEHVFRLAGWV